MLVTLGLMTMGMADSLKGPILAAESVVLLFMAIRRNNFIIQIGSLIVVAIAAVYALNDTRLGSEDFFLAGLFTGLIFYSTPGFVTRESSRRASPCCGRG